MKFFKGDKDFKYGGVLCKKFMSKCAEAVGMKVEEILDPDGWWEGRKDRIRKGIDTKRSAVSTEIKKAFASKLLVMLDR